jgi:hypothetical protein
MQGLDRVRENISKKAGEKAMNANTATRGIPRYHEGFSFRVLPRKATPPHSVMNAQKEG